MPTMPRSSGIRWWELSWDDRAAIRKAHPGWTENELSSYRWLLSAGDVCVDGGEDDPENYG